MSDKYAARFIPAGAGNTRLGATSLSLNSVYPRWRGEHSGGICRKTKPRGLSPLARFIPAGAGNTIQGGLRTGPPAVYPRWRGEHSDNINEPIHICGLSPLARGTPVSLSDHRQNNRFIPAGAGNTVMTLPLMAGAPVYPRWRGEHPHGIYTRVWIAGLSPLARGTPREIFSVLSVTRFIPAGAGNTPAIRLIMLISSVYPR